jgi:four helix bundle protein
MNVKNYRDLIVWQKAMDLAVEIHPIALSFPKVEMFALTSQLNRCSTSVPSNIAEGHGRRSTGEYLHFLGIARGSLNELETQITLALRYDYIPELVHDQIIEHSGEVGRMLNGLMDSLERRMNH